MGKLFRYVVIINLVSIVLQFCVLSFQIYRWNEVVGSIYSIIISLIGCWPSGLNKNKDRRLIGLYAFLLLGEMIIQLVNMILLIGFQWVVIQYCINQNVSVDISAYGGVACYDWWHFGHGVINYRDRALITTVLLALVSTLRLIQLVLTATIFKRQTTRPMLFVDRVYE